MNVRPRRPVDRVDCIYKTICCFGVIVVLLLAALVGLFVAFMIGSQSVGDSTDEMLLLGNDLKNKTENFIRYVQSTNISEDDLRNMVDIFRRGAVFLGRDDNWEFVSNVGEILGSVDWKRLGGIVNSVLVSLENNNGTSDILGIVGKMSSLLDKGGVIVDFLIERERTADDVIKNVTAILVSTQNVLHRVAKIVLDNEPKIYSLSDSIMTTYNNISNNIIPDIVAQKNFVFQRTDKITEEVWDLLTRADNITSEVRDIVHKLYKEHRIGIDFS